jgi:hypothetical protein
MKHFILLLVASLTSVLITGCASSVAERRQVLLKLYPPGQATRTDVAEAYAPYWKPREEQTGHHLWQRPTTGWSNHDVTYVRDYAIASESRTGKQVYAVEQYSGPSGYSLFGLCHCFYYYDERDVLVDADWFHASD